MKRILFIITLFCFSIYSNAQQFTSYTSDDVYEKHAEEIEELSSEWIKTYNRFKTLYEKEHENDGALYLVNLNKAWNNLLDAPPVIINYGFNISDSLSTNIVEIELINSTPKTITEITFTFTFECYGKEVYDINTGDNDLIIKFNNIKGRSNNTNDIIEILESNIFSCYHLLNNDSASYIKPFYNKRADTIVIKDINIKFNDGNTTNKVAIFKEGILENKSPLLLYYGPLSPLFRYY